MQQRVMRAAVAAALALAGCRDRGPVAVIRGPGAAVEGSLEVAATPAERARRSSSAACEASDLLDGMGDIRFRAWVWGASAMRSSGRRPGPDDVVGHHGLSS